MLPVVQPELERQNLIEDVAAPNPATYQFNPLPEGVPHPKEAEKRHYDDPELEKLNAANLVNIEQYLMVQRGKKGPQIVNVWEQPSNPFAVEVYQQ